MSGTHRNGYAAVGEFSLGDLFPPATFPVLSAQHLPAAR